MYKVYRSARFDKELSKQLSKKEIEEVEKIETKQLTNNPYVGDPLGYRFLREKKIWGKRIYYLIYDDINAVLMVAVSNKKAQQSTIDEIKNHLKYYYEITREAVTQHV